MSGKTERTAIGYCNDNGQKVVAAPGWKGNGSRQKIYVLRCKHCKCVYGSNGCDNHERTCPNPKCQNGKGCSRLDCKSDKMPKVDCVECRSEACGIK